MSAPLNYEQFDVPAHEVQEGDYIHARKSKVTKAAQRNDSVLLAHRARGTRSGSITEYPKDQVVRVWRKNSGE